MNILLTGATGFLGLCLADILNTDARFDLTCVVRRPRSTGAGMDVLMDSLQSNQQWATVLAGKDAVIHAAARAHIMKDEALDPLAEYRKVNVEGTLNLARQAATAGVKRFIFISSIKVNGEQTPPGKPFFSHDAPSPEDVYGTSKYEAEVGLRELAAETGTEVVIIRPP